MNHITKRIYRSYMHRQGISNHSVPHEQEWLTKWGVLSKPAVCQYRFSSYYVGYDINIVPESLVHNIISPILNPIQLRGYYSDKNMYDSIFPVNYTPATLVRRIRGGYFNDCYQYLATFDYATLLHLIEQHERILIKPSVDTSSGRGIRIFECKNNIYTAIDDQTILSIDFLNNYGTDFIIQECVRQNTFLNRLNCTSVNTIRIATYRSINDDKINILGSIIRIGGKGAIVDNAHQGGCFVGIEQMGRLGKYVVNQYGDKYNTFNDIDFSQEDLVLPDYDKIKNFAIDVAKRIIHHRLLQLDITVDSNDMIKLIEFNISGFSPWLFQFTGHCAFGEFTDEIIEYCKNNKSKGQKVMMYFA